MVSTLSDCKRLMPDLQTASLQALAGTWPVDLRLARDRGAMPFGKINKNLQTWLNKVQEGTIYYI